MALPLKNNFLILVLEETLLAFFLEDILILEFN